MIRQNKYLYAQQGRFKQTGFSLVELMVGLVIGLLASLAIMQAFSAFEGQKRSTSGSSDAQTNGTIALASIQRDAQSAGFGLALPMADADNNALKCDAIADFNGTNVFPVVITDGTSDTIMVRYSTTALGAVPVEIKNVSNATDGTQVVNNIGCNANDLALIMNGSSCKLTTVASTFSAAPKGGNYFVRLDAAAGAPLLTGAKLACMGDWANYTYQVVSSKLQRNNLPLVSEVVTMQAQYGVSDVASNNQVTQWVDAKGSWLTPTVADRNRIKAIRVAVVVRNGLLEKTNVTDTCASGDPTLCTWTDKDAPVISLSTIANWQQYRYRTFKTIIPLRNMLWSRCGITGATCS
jgi:type IV pilus assembly protein PilW